MRSSTHVASIDARLAALPAFPRLQGRRLHLRGPRVEDADGLFALFSDPAVMRYWSRPPMIERGEAEGLIAEIHAGFEQRELINWIVTSRDGDVPIGTCSLSRFDARHGEAEIGYALRPELWGQGLAREAVTLALDWGFHTLGLRRIEASIDPRNHASRGLLQRLGFASEGVLQQPGFVGTVVTDSEVFGLLADDWSARRLA